MENLTVSKYMSLIEPLDFEVKLELIARLTESLKRSFATSKPEPKLKTGKAEKEKLLLELAGSWSDVDDGLVDEIISSRTFSDKEINLD